MRFIVRVFGVIVIIYLGVMGLMYLQYLFDQGDLKKALRVIDEYKPVQKDGKTLRQLMAETLGVSETEVVCDAQILSRYEGRIEVTCHRFAETVGVTPFLWEVNVVSFQVRARDDFTRGLFPEHVSLIN